jgi:hypothetical protein
MLLLTSPPPTNPGGFGVWCAIGFTAGIYLFFRGFVLLRRRRLVLDTPFSKIRSASMGMVEVSGLAVGPHTMLAPITARPCYFYRTLAWEWKQQGKNKAWVKVAGECMYVPFFLDDNTGRVLVDPRGAELDLHCDFREEFNTSFFSSNDAPANVCSFLSRHGVATSNKIKIEECCIKPKNALFILGTLGDNPGIEVTAKAVPDPEALNAVSARGFSLPQLSMPGFSLSIGSSPLFSPSGRSGVGGEDSSTLVAARTLASSSSAVQPRGARSSSYYASPKVADQSQQHKVADALLRAGITNPVAWSAAGLGTAVQMSPDPTFAARSSSCASSCASSGASTSASSSEVGENRSNLGSTGPIAAQADLELHPPVVLMKGTNNKTFLISWRSQQEVARSLGWKCTLMIWGGPALALFSLYGLIGLVKMFR